MQYRIDRYVVGAEDAGLGKNTQVNFILRKYFREILQYGIEDVALHLESANVYVCVVHG